jgi:hypothetical protein
MATDTVLGTSKSILYIMLEFAASEKFTHLADNDGVEAIIVIWN